MRKKMGAILNYGGIEGGGRGRGGRECVLVGAAESIDCE